MKWRIDARAGIGYHVHSSDLESHVRRITATTCLMAHVFRDSWGRQPGKYHFAVPNRMTEVDQVATRCTLLDHCGTGAPLVPLVDDLPIQDADLSYHQQAEILDDVFGQRLIVDAVCIDIQTESLPLYSPAVRKIDFEVEANSLVGGLVAGRHGPGLFGILLTGH